MAKICNKCGNQLPEESKFCTKCGTQFGESVEEVELGQARRIEKEPIKEGASGAFNLASLVNWVKQNMMIAGVVVVVVIAAIFLMNRSPLSGEWVYKAGDEEIVVTIKGSKITINTPYSSDTDVAISGKLAKDKGETYKMPLSSMTAHVVLADEFDNRGEYDDFIKEFEDELSEATLTTAQRKQMKQFIKSIKYKDNGISFTVKAKDLDSFTEFDQSDVDIMSDFVDLFSEAMVGEYGFTKKGKDTLVWSFSGIDVLELNRR